MESPPSESARRMGCPGLWWQRLTAGSSTPREEFQDFLWGLWCEWSPSLPSSACHVWLRTSTGAEARFLFGRFTRRLSAALPRCCMGSGRSACGATDVVAFAGVALSKSSEGWGCGIPRLAKDARHGAPRFVVVAAYSRFLTGPSSRFGMTRPFLGHAGPLWSCPSRSPFPYI